MKKLVIVFGTRPQIVKLSELVKELNKHPEIDYTLINTGQHYSKSMNDNLLDELGITEVHHCLNVTTPDPVIRLSEMMVKLKDLYLQIRPDVVVVIGDTDSTLAGALTANKMKIPVAHIEAQVRSGNRDQPEEINRILVDEISRYHFIPGSATDFPDPHRFIYTHCDLQLDAYLNNRERARKTGIEVIAGLRYIYLTMHRANVDAGIVFNLFTALFCIGKKVIWPLHPRLNWVKDIEFRPDNLILIDPVSYLESLALLEGCDAVMTDSGGLAREALWAGKPLTILRTESEWAGQKLESFDPLNIVTAYHQSNLSKINAERMIKVHGGGKAAESIVLALM